MTSHPITSSQIEGERMADFKLLRSKVTADDNCSYEIKRQLLPGRKAMPYLESEIAQSCLTPWNCSLPGFAIHEIFQARILEWVAISFSRGSSWPSNWTWVCPFAGKIPYCLSHQESMPYLDSVLKGRDITLLTKVCIVKPCFCQ